MKNKRSPLTLLLSSFAGSLTNHSRTHPSCSKRNASNKVSIASEEKIKLTNALTQMYGGWQKGWFQMGANRNPNICDIFKSAVCMVHKNRNLK